MTDERPSAEAKRLADDFNDAIRMYGLDGAIRRVCAEFAWARAEIARLRGEGWQPIKGIEGFIDEISELGTSPLTPHGRDCVRTILLAFSAHIRRQVLPAPPDADGPRS